jgi:predicted membrane chloride channel (bestrophin family)
MTVTSTRLWLAGISVLLVLHETTAFLRFSQNAKWILRTAAQSPHPMAPRITVKAQAIIDKFVNFDKEKNRKFRRTVFDKQDWKRHRSSNRYIQELMNMPSSLVLRGLSVQAFGVAAWALAIITYNFLVKKNPLRMRVLPPMLSIPGLPLSLLCPSLGLLLVFRTNKAYERWREGRIAWSEVNSKIFDVVRQSSQWIADKIIVARCARYLIAYSRCLKWHLGHQDNDRRLRDDLEEILTTSELERLMASNFRVQHTLSQLSRDVATAGMPPNLQVHIDKSLGELSNAYFNCDRIYTTPIPVSYTRHTARFLLIFVMTLPMALYNEFAKGEKLIGTFVIPLITFMSSIFLFAIEELGVQIEEPFGILPLARLCSISYNLAKDMLADQGISWFFGTEQVEASDLKSVETISEEYLILPSGPTPQKAPVRDEKTKDHPKHDDDDDDDGHRDDAFAESGEPDMIQEMLSSGISEDVLRESTKVGNKVTTFKETGLFNVSSSESDLAHSNGSLTVAK